MASNSIILSPHQGQPTRTRSIAAPHPHIFYTYISRCASMDSVSSVPSCRLPLAPSFLLLFSLSRAASPMPLLPPCALGCLRCMWASRFLFFFFCFYLVANSDRSCIVLYVSSNYSSCVATLHSFTSRVKCKLVWNCIL